MRLTPKQEQFCQEYLVDINATQAAIRAGYSSRTANRIGTENLSKLVVAERISALKQERNKRILIQADEIVRELAKIAFSNMGDLRIDWEHFKDWKDLTEEQKSVIAEIKITKTESGVTRQVKLYDKLRALESLARHVGLYDADNSQHQVPVINLIYEHAPSRTERKDED